MKACMVKHSRYVSDHLARLRSTFWQARSREDLMSVFKDAGHLFRFAGLFVLVSLVFLVLRHYAVPKSFGQYGHYRGAAMGEIASHPMKYSGHEACETCHSDVADKKNAGKHAHVNCEACHEALFQHAPTPAATKPTVF